MPLFRTLQLFSDPIARAGPWQMALDEVLLESVTLPVLRVYRWAGPAVSFGYSQSLATVMQKHPSLPLVRRWTGGGIVEHGCDWTFSLLVPCDEPLAKLRPTETYRLLHEVFAGVLAAGARLIGAEETLRGEACFESPALHDVVANDGRKLCGGAQRRTRRGLLHQGSIQNIALPENFAPLVAGALAEKVISFPACGDLPVRAGKLAAARYASPAWRKKTA